MSIQPNKKSNRPADALVASSEKRLKGFALITQGQVTLWKAMLVSLFFAGFAAAMAFAVGLNFGNGTLAAEANQTDLAVLAPPIVSGTLTKGSTLTIEGTVKNQGTVKADNFTNEFEIDLNNATQTFTGADLRITPTQPWMGLQPSGSKSRTASWINIPAGTHLVRMCADPTKQVAESDETNNCGPAAQVGSGPNIVLIMTDDQDAASLSFMQHTQQYANLGTKFSRFYFGYPLCCPSRATFFTGQYGHNNGVMDNAAPLGGYAKLDHTNTLSVWLKSAGYSTAHIGKYLNGYGVDDATSVPGAPPYEIPQGWDFWNGLAGRSSSGIDYYDYELNENGTLVPYGSAAQDYLTDVLTNKAIAYIQQSAGSGAPFFLSVGYYAPHGRGGEGADSNPIGAPRHVGAFANESLPQPPSFNEANVSDKPQYIQRISPFSSTTINDITSRYRTRLESLLAVDEGVESIVNALTQAGKLQNTIIIFTTDNGWFNGEHRLRAKRELYEEASRSPFFLYAPGLFPASQTISALVSNVDFAPFVLDVAGANAALVMDGVSFLPLLTNPSAPWRTSLLIEAAKTGSFRNAYSAVRTQQYVYAEHDTGEKELYDLAADPYQLQSQHNNPAFNTIKSGLAQTLDVLKNCTGSGCWR